MSDEGNQDDQLEELDQDVHGFRGDVLLQADEDPVKP